MPDLTEKGVRAAQIGIVVNAVLATVKLLAGIIGNSYVLIADAIESGTDIFSSLILMAGLMIARREPNEEYPFGYGRAETLAATVVAILLLGAATGISVEAVREIRTPHHLPAAWTLAVLVITIVVKWIMSRRVRHIGAEIGSMAVKADAWHHLSDALTSLAAFVGISVALWGGEGWESADDWAALIAALIIAYNGLAILYAALRDLMDATPDGAIVARIREVAEGVPGVLAIEKLIVRRSGLVFHVAIHVQASPSMPLSESHALGGHVKAIIRQGVPQAGLVVVHMEPFEGTSGESREPRGPSVG